MSVESDTLLLETVDGFKLAAYVAVVSAFQKVVSLVVSSRFWMKPMLKERLEPIISLDM